MTQNFDIVIGLEIHAELNTNTKAFCGCSNSFGSEPNTNCCPICLGYPNTAGKINKSAFKKTIMAGLVFDCRINETTFFQRKHYFYPDLGNGFQTTQLQKPICVGGGIKLKNGRFIRLNRIQLEEDTGKLQHSSAIKKTLVDYNRGGIPLIEIITEPDFTSKEEVVEFLEEVRSRLSYSNIAACKMEEGGMRCDVNISLKPNGSKTLGNRVEIKNLNSFKGTCKAIELETERQAKILRNNQKVPQETRKCDDATGETTAMRNKSEDVDYRYFPAPGMPVIKITPNDIAKIRAQMPPLPHELKEKFVREHGLPEYDADVLLQSKDISDFYMECTKHYDQYKKISNWIMVDLLKIMKVQDTNRIPVSAEHLTEIIKMTENKLFTKAVGLQLLDQVISTQKSPDILVKELGLLTQVGEQQIVSILCKLRDENPKVTEDYKVNKEKVEKFIIGFVMKNTQGKAKSDIVAKLISEVF